MPNTIKRPRRPQPAKWLLVKNGLLQRHVCERSGATPSQVSVTLDGRITPSQRIALACSELLSQPVEELFDADLLATAYWYRRHLREIEAAGVDRDE